MSGTDQTAPCSKWIEYAAGALPVTFKERKPKALWLNAAGNIVIVDEDGTSITVTPAIGIAIPVRPKTITSTTASAVVALFD